MGARAAAILARFTRRAIQRDVLLKAIGQPVQRLQNPDQNALGICERINVPEPQHVIALALEPRGAHLIRTRICMLSAVQLDNQLLPQTTKVENVRFGRHLLSKAMPPQVGPREYAATASFRHQSSRAASDARVRVSSMSCDTEKASPQLKRDFGVSNTRRWIESITAANAPIPAFLLKGEGEDKDARTPCG
jgi:hypothetical protein